jgi:hypothetical protein
MNRVPLSVVRAWNWMGALLLLNVVTITWLSTPTPMRVFMNEPANIWITQAPFVWLPTVLVLAAFAGHIVVHRRLKAEFGDRPSARQVVEGGRSSGAIAAS